MIRLALLWLALVSAATAAEFFVSPTGDDSAPGTKDKPFATLFRARDAARAAAHAADTAAVQRIAVMPGDYFLDRTLDLDARDSGLTIEAAPGGAATLYGGVPVTGWKRDGDKFWCADLPGVREGAWDFRALVVNGRMPPRARFPESGTFVHKSVFDVRWLSSVGGGWERPPTTNELTTMLYDPADLPASLDARNAEVRIYHMWDESLAGVARNDTARHALILSPPAKSPPGAFGVKKYVVFNTREGMTQPGQWYLDRTAGRLVYWPLPGEDMAKARVIAPRLERVVSIAGTARQPAERIKLRGLGIQATTTPLKSGGFGAYAFDGAVRLDRVRGCALEKLEICNVGGQGIVAAQVTDTRISDCHVHDTGACGIKAEGADSLIARNHIHHVGAHYPSAVAVSVSTPAWRTANAPGFRVLRNEVHDTPYSGMIGSGGNHRFEENLISRVMRELHDGGAIYGGMKRSVLRGNVFRDVVKVGEGYGVSAYYLDEGAEDCVVERNVSVGVERPTHNHIARNLVIRDNVFIAETNMTLSFQRSTKCTFTGNTLFAPGTVTVSPPNAVTVWSNNVVMRGGPGRDGVPQAFSIDDAMPAAAAPARRTYAIPVVRAAQPPVPDGEIGTEEWPGSLLGLDREPSRWSASGAPAFAEFAWDDRCLYVAVNVVVFDVANLRKGGAWGEDDGAEVCVRSDAGTFVLRGFRDGSFASVTDAGAPPAAAERLGEAVRFAGKPYGKTRGGWHGEWAIPFDALGLKPAAGLKIPFNLGVYRAEDGIRRCLEGTLGENWRLDEAAVLQLK